MSHTNDGKDFELAVYRIVSAMGRGAIVKYDHMVRDRDTGTMRQCDVWIEGLFQGHFPIKYLVSCKDKSRKLSIEDVTAFKGQIDSVGASSGAIYSRKGFSQSAIVKAKALGIACCRLYVDQPADLPQVLLFRAYTCLPHIKVVLKNVYMLSPKLKTWNDLFSLTVNDAVGTVAATILDLLANEYRMGEEESLSDRNRHNTLFPPDFVRTLEFFFGTTAVSISASWKKYRANLNAHLINGSFSLTNGDFKGHQCSPSIDTWGPTPGPGWEELTDDTVLPADAGTTLIRLYGSSIRELLLYHFRQQTLPAHTV